MSTRPSPEDLPARLRALPPARARLELLDLVLAELTRVLPEAGPITPGRRFADLGLASLDAIDLHRGLTAATGLALPVSLAFDRPTAADLVDLLAEQLLGSAVEVEAAPVRVADDDPIVLVGMGCRLPGGVSSPEDLWRLLTEETDAIGDFPADRGWDAAAAYDPDPDRPGHTYVRSGGFLPDAGGFDAAFFGVSPREAVATDPQQRLLLEVAWEAVERAGIDPRSLAGTATGVFIGVEDHEYGPRLVDAADGAEGYLITGNAASVASGRIAYTLGLHGPALTVDTACSGSLVALHLAARSLARGECELALAGGAAVMATLGGFLAFSRQRGLSPDGRCKAFAEGADGTAWGEGVGIVVLERLSDARRHGHHVLAVLKGSAINSDGATNGLTAPSGRAQQRVIRAALAAAGLEPSDVDAVEAHGTGTPLGDLVEAQALIAAYGQDRDEPLWLGSLKSNTGHTQAAAGVAGVIKMVLALRHGVLPRTLHADTPSSRIDWAAGSVRLLNSARAWDTDRPRRAGVSAFGFSGTNAHLILEQAPEQPEIISSPSVLAAGSGTGLLFPGTGFDLVDSGLYQRYPAFARELDRVRAELEVYASRPLGPVLLGEIEDTECVAPVAFALEAALLALLRAQGIAPDLVAGAGVGRVTAAYAAGSLSLSDAAALAVALGRDLTAEDRRWAVEVLRFRSAGVPVVGVADLAIEGDADAAALRAAGAVTVLEVGPAAVGRVVPWVLSAGTPTALRAQAAQLAEVGGDPAVVARSLAGTRAALEHRAIVVGTERDELIAGLRAIAADEPAPQVVLGRAGDAGAVVFAFPGQGGQWVGMARELLDSSSVFAAAMGECAAALSSFVDWDLRDVLGDEDSLARVDVVQPALWAVMVSLAELWRSMGVEPAAVVGHSQGEIAAFCVAGGLSLVDGARVVALRSKAIADTLAGLGGMAAVALSAERVGELIDDRLSVAAVNGPSSVVVSGEVAALEELVARCVADEVRARILPVDYASHSAQVERIAERLLVELAPVLPRSAEVLVYSSVTGEAFDTAGADAAYWVRNLRETVLFERAARAAAADGHGTWVEVGPHPVLAGALRESLGDDAVITGTLRRDEGGPSRVLLSLAELFAAGVPVSWTAVVGAGDWVELPTYPFEHEHFWLADAPRVAVGDAVSDLRYREVWRPLNLGPAHPGPWLVLGAGSDASALAAALGAGTVVADAVPEGEFAGVLALQADPVALLRTPLPAPLWMATRGAVAVDGEDVDPAQARVWGLGRVAALEHPAAWGGLVDLPEVLDPQTAQSLASVLDGAEDQIAVRANGVFGRRLVRAAEVPAGRWRARGTVLITGGGGGLGRQVAHWALERGAEHVLLLSRTAADLTGFAGLPVTAVACDVADQDAVAAAMSTVDTPVTAVLHLSGVRQEPVGIAEVTEEQLAAEWRPKVIGAQVLDTLTRDLDLDAFVLFTSGTGAWGAAGQAGCAAADASLDALAARRRAGGRVATAMAWGAWAGAGMTGEIPGRAEQLRRAGVPPIAPHRALAALDAALLAGDTAVVVADVDWGRFLPAFTAARPSPLLSELAEPTPVAENGFAARYTALPAAERPRFLRELVSGHAAAALGHTAADRVDPGRALHAQGFDSLTSVELRNRLVAATGLTLPATLVFDHPTTTALAAHLAELLGDAGPVSTDTRVAVAGDDPIAIVGMACRLPGGVDDPDALWRLVAEGGDAVTGFPTDRGWEVDALAAAGGVVDGGFLDGAGDFDAGFFGISPREALATDPQQRLFLEASWSALEHAGIDPESLAGAAVGVFAGAIPSGYAELVTRAYPELAGHLVTGGAQSVLSGRVAYVLGLQGPALTIDTACSSSLVALHLAVQAVRSGECSMALAGGVTVMASTEPFVGFTQQGGLSPDGRCKAFAESADGTGWSEGVGVLVVQRLSDAVREGREVLAVVRGTAVNQDGASNGLTAPSGPAQQKVIRAALAVAGLAPSEVDVVEAHGTGTVLGDPIEAHALMATYGANRTEPLLLGSLKSNLGHTQAAAGVSGVIKMVQALRHGIAPRTLHVAKPSSTVDWSAGAVELLTESRAWPETGRPRRAAVSSFGVSGTNAHVIIEAAAALPGRAPEPGPVAWLLSGRTPEAVHAQAARLLDAPGDLRDIGWTLAGRTRFEHRAAVVGADRDELLAGLRAVAAGEAPLRGRAGAPGVALLFSGQGSQRLGMGMALYETSPVFAAAFDAVTAELDPGLRVVMWGEDAELLARTGWAQLALFAVEVAAFRLLESWGVRPEFLVGHSVGEVAAAHVAGVLSLSDAAALVSARARLMQALPTGGAMIAIEASEDEVAGHLSETVSLAAVNAPGSVVLSGVEAEVLAVAEHFADRRRTRLKVSHAFHSALMEPMLAEFEQVLAGLDFRPPTIPLVSTVDGDPATPGYWVRQVRAPVRFAEAVRRVAERGIGALVEVGPGTALAAAARRGSDLIAVPLHGDDTPVATAARLFTHGVELDWTSFFPGARRIGLPTYPFERTRYWPAGAGAGDVTGAGLTAAGHPLLGAVVSTPGTGGVLFTGRLSARTQPWLPDLVVPGHTVFPATGLLELAVRAGDAVGCDRLAELVVEAPLVLAERGCRIQVALTPAGADWAVAIHACPEGAEDWTRHATGLLTTGATRAETWQHGELPWTEVEIAEPGAFGIHPALLHNALLPVLADDRQPAEFREVVLHATGAARTRVRLTETGPDTFAVEIADGAGVPVLSIGEVITRPMTGLAVADDTAVLVPEWVAATPVQAEPADAVVLTVPSTPVPSPAAVHEITAALLDRLQRELTGTAHLVVVTEGAISTGAGEPASDLPAAAVWGLVRSAQTENPGRITLVDLAPGSGSAGLTQAIALGEPQVAVRGDLLLTPRLVRRQPEPAAFPAVDGTVLITGGTGGLGAQVARHLVTTHGVRDLLLLSRRGGGADLVAELAGLGATATVLACDVSDRDALAAVLADHPVGGVVHTAGVVDDGVVDALTTDRLAGVLRPKVDATWHLHELVGDVPLFALFSSLAGVFGGAGQGNYAAANAFVDAFAQWRQANGQHAVALAWGSWSAEAGLTSRLSELDLRRMNGSGLPPLAVEQGLALFDRVVGAGEPVLGLTRLDREALRRQRELPVVLRALAGRTTRRAAGDGPDGFAERYAVLPTAERIPFLRALITGRVAAVLGHGSPADADRAFKDLGFDSLTAVELRNELAAATGLALPPTLVFDHPTATVLAGHLAELLDSAPRPVTATVSGAATDEQIAIVGLGCRFPGADSPDELWDLVAAGRDVITGFPADRGWDLDAGASVTAQGGFLGGVGDFDAEFFGISPREALATDPQQRLLLETSWEALEHAGIDPLSLAGSPVGVFVGAFDSGYGQVAGRSDTDAAGHLMTGGATSVASGRIAYSLGLQGPAITVDTACSSSLVALHLAVQALRAGECSMALAGGATVMATPETFVGFTQQGGLAPDGRCKAFADGADGTGWSEGVGVLVVQRLSDAVREGRRVLAVVRGSAVNQDGASNGLTAPNGPAQQRVIRAALAGAGLRPSEVDLVEAHGTGTVLGDPIEAQALLATYGQDRERPLYLGSLKSNLGHTQAAAGVAGIIKVVQAMRHGVLPPTLHVDSPSSKVEWSGGAVALLTESAPWPSTGRPRRAGVSSFGMSGTNAHVILEAPEPVAERVPVEPAVVPWVLSGRTAEAVRAQAERLLGTELSDPAAVGLTLAGRSVFEHRAVVTGADRDELVAGLRALAAGTPVPEVVLGVAEVAAAPVFVFPGQGSQWTGMALELWDSSPVFAAAMGECATALSSFVDWQLRDVLGDEDSLARVDVVQPALWAVMVSLAAVWRSMGVAPAAVIGHSQGEIAAFCVAGGLSLVDGARVVALRSKAIADTLAGLGGMAAVALPAERVAELIDERLSVAAVNGPSSVVVSGEVAALHELVARCVADGVRATVLPVDYASHSAQVELLRARLLAELAPIAPRSSGVPVYSAVTGQIMDTAEADAAYWVLNLRETVRFAEAVRAAATDGHLVFAEISPHPVLVPAVPEIVPDAVVTGTLRRDEAGPARVHAGAAQLFVRGVPVDWAGLFAGVTPVDLPTYPFQHERFWPTASGQGDVAGAGLATAGHPLLAAVVELPGGGVLLTGRLVAGAHPWLAGRAAFPEAGLVELALRAATEVGCDRVAELTVHTPLLLPANGGVRLRVSVTPGEGGWELAMHARLDGVADWTSHATGVLGTGAVWPGPVDGPWTEVEVPEADGYDLHPALLATALDTAPDELACAFTDVALFATGATLVRAARSGDRLLITDHTGAPVFAATVATRPLTDADLAAITDATLLVPRWSETPVPVAAAVEHTVLAVPHTPEPTPAAVHEVVTAVLAELQSCLARESAHLVVTTRGAVAVGAEPVLDLPAAAVWGLVRSAQTENPDRITLLDLDADLDPGLVAGLLALGESQAAVRDGVVHVPRLVRTTPADTPASLPGPVLITGGLGGLGGLFARHLVRARGVRELVLLGRRGADTPGATELLDELTGLGAEVTVAACDVTDRAALAAVFAAHPVRTVVHTAGVLDDGVIGSLTAERVHRVLAPKVDALWHLHELAAPDTALVVFSSLAGLLGGPGQGNYAAGNTFADTLVQWRRDRGLPGVSLAWGAWTPEIGLTGTLTDVDLRRMARAGMPLLTVAQGLDLFDAALATTEPVLGLTRLDTAALRTTDDLPPLLRTLAGVLHRRTAAGRTGVGGFAEGWTALPAAEQVPALRELVRGHIAGVLGHRSPGHIEDERAFRALGFDSLTAVELRNAIATATGLTLPATLVFDYPTVTALAEHLAIRLGGGSTREQAQPVAVVAEDPIVIVGMACRFPGGVAGPEDLWRLLAEGRDAIGGFPADRGWDLAALAGGDSATARGGFLRGVADFDAAFFGISPREALAMDPQQRVLLETSWEALEDAGIDPGTLSGKPVGVFVGAFPSGYTELATRADPGLAGHLITGGSQSVISGRVAYSLGLHGPAVTVDTACSSSLVALHLAVQALRGGECTMALAGGVTVIATPDTFVGFSQQGGLAPDGRCKAFADGADGTGWSEGAGVLVVQRLSDAVREGREILAVVRGSAVNQDGASNGLTAPNGPAQQRVIQAALAGAGLRPSDVDVVEAHGTGTVLGDPIEAQALLATYGQDRDTPLRLGSIKSNLGHTQAAAGVAGIIKLVLAMRHEVLPPTLHVDRPSSKVDWTEGAIELLTESTPWPGDQPRRAGVSSFGVSGTNAHVVLEAPTTRSEPAHTPVTGALPWVLSGRTPEAVRAQAARLLDADPGSPADVAWTLATTRARFDHRAVVVGRDRGELLAGLRAIAADQPAATAVRGYARDGGPVAVLFSGQGSQRLGMGKALYETSPVFAAAFDAVAAELDPGLRAVMWGSDAEALARTGWAQPALFAVEVALFRLLESWGVRPDYLVGHSIGELAAAHVAGVLTLADAALVVSARARLMQALPEGGAMVAVEAPEAEVTPFLTEGVSLAAVNTPGSVVLSGVEDEVLALAETFALLGHRTKQLTVSHAFHSPLMEPMLAEFERILSTVDWKSPAIPIVSTLTGEPADLAGPDYWVRQVRGTVRFADAVAWLTGQGVRTLVEAGPGGVLSGMVAGVPMLHGADEPVAVTLAAARLFTLGVPVAWPEFLPAGHRVALPSYAFQRDRYWVAVPANESWPEGDLGELAASLGVAEDVLTTALTAWRARGRGDQVVDGWCYRESWRALDTPAAAESPCLVVVPATHIEDPWVTTIVSALGARVLPVAELDRADLAKRLAELTPARIVSLLALRPTDGVVPAGVLPTVVLLQALGDADIQARVWAVTRGAVSVGGHDPVADPGQAGIWGVARVAALERPGSWGGVVDLPAALDGPAARRLAAVITADWAEDQVAVRASGVLGRRLVHAGAGSGQPWRTSGTALVTGGTGGLGAFVARWLVERGAEHVVLLSRRGLAAAGARKITEELTALGARVTVAACDVGDRDVLAAVLAEIPDLRVVVHAAGVSHGVVELDEVTAEGAAAELGAKVAGATHLDELTRGIALDAFVLFSSGAAAWGSGGQAAYAAGNAYLDALAAHRVAAGLPGTAVAWGNWAEAGMAVDNPEQGDYLRRLGVLPMPPAQALTALDRALRAGEAGLTVTDMDWTRFAPAFTVSRPSPLLEDLPEVAEALSSGPAAEGSDFVRRWTATPAGERPRFLREFLRGHVLAALGHGPGTRIEPGQAFRELGFDSLTAVELRNQLAAATGLALPATLAFDYPSINALAAHVAAELDPPGSAQPAPARAAHEDDEAELLAADVDELVRIALGGAEST
ncbi:acyl transferase domain-containing protein/acyl carrier protein [Crossiella cryophila]|uniref:6-deoxyerythronolide-B synthase n=1 Tax=Crossiella cryophila TaxID=43355 RepID=A0A7W7FY20_9PSEU|nr:type I polyketide synthase [Crossiella cryophila]MBB4679599.1 acyl transferase domain-containing protein/acyl carrier protein [Crossiella cryophila]